MATKKKGSKDQDNPNKTLSGDEGDAEKVVIVDPEGYNTENYQCLRNSQDGSMYYGEVGYLKKESGQVIRHGTEAYDQIKIMTDE